MSHSSAGRSSTTSNESDNGLVGVSVLLQPLSSLLLSSSTDLSDHHDTLGLRIVGEALQTVDEVGSVERITTNTHDGGLTKTVGGGLPDSLVGQGSRAGHNTDLTGLVDVTRHDTDLALAGLDDTRAVGSDQAGGLLALHDVLDTEHVVLGDSLSNTDDERNLGGNGLEDGSSSTAGRHVNDGGVGVGSLLGLQLIRRKDLLPRRR